MAQKKKTNDGNAQRARRFVGGADDIRIISQPKSKSTKKRSK